MEAHRYCTFTNLRKYLGRASVTTANATLGAHFLALSLDSSSKYYIIAYELHAECEWECGTYLALVLLQPHSELVTLEEVV